MEFEPSERRPLARPMGRSTILVTRCCTNGGSMVQLTDLLATLSPATFGGNGFPVAFQFSFTTRDLPDIHVVTFHGELDIVSADGLADALVEVAGSTLVVDLSDLTFMDCSGIDALVLARNRILANGQGQLVVTRPTAIVRKALETVGLGGWIVGWSPDWNEESHPGGR